ncbi:alpha/beta hydrolase [Chitinophaga filiformis]|uniref:alpha/beta hydrolase n=1 Tax=Chitinophaga filiformis TaxID=104663 RepID=UPI001F217086|nr:alpha/beta hydrolase [Chitinophaga filiformis]MCF6403977.1 alpha/beta hydrolase [Chitinophaga filiformis]
MALAVSCNPAGVTPTPLEMLNVHYGDDPQQVMDIYLPKNATPETTRIMVFIHGGGWKAGDKSDFTAYINNMRSKNADANYAYFNLNYRLVKDSTNILPVAEEDIIAALEYIWGRANSFHISPLTGLIGISAGAHLAALQGCRHNKEGYIRSMVCIYGIYDMKRFYDQGGIGASLASIAVGGSPDQKPELYRFVSPLFFVTAQTPPVLLMHGTQDTLVHYPQAVAMDSVLQKAGVVHELYSFKGGHEMPADVADLAAEKLFSFTSMYTK